MSKTALAIFLGMLMILSSGLIMLTPAGNVYKENVINYPVAQPTLKARAAEGTNLSQWGYFAFASSQYGTSSWSAMSATGAPDATNNSDDSNAWTPTPQDGGMEWLEVHYLHPVNATGVNVYETYNPNFVTKIEVRPFNSTTYTKVWEGVDDSINTSAWLNVTFAPTVVPVSGVRVWCNTSLVLGWNEIDAVELVGKWTSDMDLDNWTAVEEAYTGTDDTNATSHLLNYTGIRGFVENTDTWVPLANAKVMVWEQANASLYNWTTYTNAFGYYILTHLPTSAFLGYDPTWVIYVDAYGYYPKQTTEATLLTEGGFATHDFSLAVIPSKIFGNVTGDLYYDHYSITAVNGTSDRTAMGSPDNMANGYYLDTSDGWGGYVADIPIEITLQLAAPTTVKKVKFWQLADMNKFDRYARAKDVTITFSDSTSVDATLKDAENTEQVVALTPKLTSSLLITITSVYQSAFYPSDTTGFQEILLVVDGGINGATVELEGTSYWDTTNATGYYEINNVPVGAYNLTVSETAYVTQVVPKTVNLAQTIEQDFAISWYWTGALRGKMYSPNGGQMMAYATSESSDANNALKAVDGVTDDGLSSSHYWQAASYTLANLTLDLGKVTALSSIKAINCHGPYSNIGTGRYQLLLSNDNVVYTWLANETFTLNDITTWNVTDATGKSARYVLFSMVTYYGYAGGLAEIAVIDSLGAEIKGLRPIPDVYIDASINGTSYYKYDYSNVRGEYRIVGLMPGAFNVTFETNSVLYKGKSIYDVSIPAGTLVYLNSTLPSSGLNDTDGDNIPDNEDTDIDGDGYNNTVEDYMGTDNASALSRPLDTDGDGRVDGDANNTMNWMDLDDDNDGYSDYYESVAGSDAKDYYERPDDVDYDGLPDVLDPDSDNDGWSNVDEAAAGTDPLLNTDHPRYSQDMSMERGLTYLATHQTLDGGTYNGSWSNNVGITSLGALAFMNRGYTEAKNKTVAAAIKFILSMVKSDGSITVSSSYDNYETSMAILALVTTHNPAYQQVITNATKYIYWLQQDEGEGYNESSFSYGGVGYGGDAWVDLSNTQWALMALDAAGVPRDNDTWAKALIFLSRCQDMNTSSDHADSYGGFDYQPSTYISPYGSMTAAGLWSLVLCGVNNTDERLSAAVGWIGRYWNTSSYHWYDNPMSGSWQYYHYLTLAKALTMAGKTTLIDGEGVMHYWFQEFVDYLLAQQNGEGWWVGDYNNDHNLGTIYAVLGMETQTLPPNANLSLTITVTGSVKLTLYDPLGRECSDETNEIPGATVSSTRGSTVIKLTKLMAGNFFAEVKGTEAGAYAMDIVGEQNGAQVASLSFDDNIELNETKGTSITVTSMEGGLTVFAQPPMKLPIMELSVSEIRMGIQPGYSLTRTFEVKEVGGLYPINGVNMHMSMLTGETTGGTLGQNWFHVDKNGIVVPKSGSKTVTMTISVPAGTAKDLYTGDIMFEVTGGGTKSIPITISTYDYYVALDVASDTISVNNTARNAIFHLTVWNLGYNQDTLGLNISATISGWTMKLSKDSLPLNGSSSEEIILTVIPPTGTAKNTENKITVKASSNGNPALSVSRDMTVKAIEDLTADAVVDSDIDGLPDSWEDDNFGSIDAYTWNDDPDGDGYTNLQEYQAKTDPNDPDSYPGHTGGGEEKDYTLFIILGVVGGIVLLIIIIVIIVLVVRSGKKKEGKPAEGAEAKPAEEKKGEEKAIVAEEAKEDASEEGEEKPAPPPDEEGEEGKPAPPPEEGKDGDVPAPPPDDAGEKEEAEVAEEEADGEKEEAEEAEEDEDEESEEIPDGKKEHAPPPPPE